MTVNDLIEIYNSRPDDTKPFEAVKLSASWMAKDYWLQNVSVEPLDINGNSAIYAPFSLSNSSSEVGLNYQRSLKIAQASDVIASEIMRRPPNGEAVKLSIYDAVINRDGTVSAKTTAKAVVDCDTVSRTVEAAEFKAASQLSNSNRTGLTYDYNAFPMLLGFDR